MSSNSAVARASTPCTICACTDVKICGLRAAVVGKQALNLESDTVDSVLVRADENSVENLAARGPGVRGMGGKGGGEGESRAGAAMPFFFFPTTKPRGGVGLVGSVGGSRGGRLHVSVFERSYDDCD